MIRKTRQGTITINICRKTLDFLEKTVLADFYRNDYTLWEYLLDILSDFSFLLPFDKELSLGDIKSLVLAQYEDTNLKIRHAMDFLTLVAAY